MPGGRPLLRMPSSGLWAKLSNMAITKLRGPLFSLCFPYSTKGPLRMGTVPSLHLCALSNGMVPGVQEMAKIFGWMSKLMEKMAFRFANFRTGVWQCEWDDQNLLITFFPQDFLKSSEKRHFIERALQQWMNFPFLLLGLGVCKYSGRTVSLKSSCKLSST